MNRTDEMLTPVAPTDQEIILQCAPGYVQVKILSVTIGCFFVLALFLGSEISKDTRDVSYDIITN